MPAATPVSNRLLGALLASVLSGLLLAGLAFPLVGGLGLTAKAGADDFLVLPEELVTGPLPARSKMLAADGSLLASFYKENRIPTSLANIPPLTQKALIAIEDARFYVHNGVDYKGTLRAAVANAKNGGVSQGGSTITQQYVKNALLQAAGSSKEAQEAARAQTVERKLKEARYALALSQRYDKDEILERYFNIAYFGNGAYGIAAAANFYFGVPAKNLTLAQGATLAGMVQSPGRYDPVKALKDPKYMTALLQRRNLVLVRMRNEGYITEQQRAVASAEKGTPDKPLFTIRPVESGCENTKVRAPYFCDYVRRMLDDTDLGKALGKTRRERQDALLGGGLVIRTTLDVKVQAAAQRAVEEAVPPADPFQAGAVADVVEPGTGLVKAMAVNRRFTESKRPGHTKVNLAIGGSSGFQAGSTFKAFTLAAALRQGIPLSTTFQSPAKYTSSFDNYVDGRIKPYTVRNAGDSESGTFDMVQATHDSVNTYFIQLLEKVGIEPAASLAESLGLRQFEGGRPSAKLLRGGAFTLGVDEVSPLAMASAYATFAAHGLYCPPVPVTEIIGRDGKPVELTKPGCTQVLEAPIADTVTDVLRGVIDGSTKGRTGRRASIGRPAAGKTGTTNGSKAAWFVGYTPQLATAVWVGDPGSPGHPVRDMRNVRINGQRYQQVYGGTIPAIIWQRTMSKSLRDVPVVPFTKPERILAEAGQVPVPDVSGLPLRDAEQALTDAGFDVRDGGSVSAAPLKKGKAAYTSPKAGTELAYGSRVTLFEASGRRSRRGKSQSPAAEPDAPATLSSPAG